MNETIGAKGIKNDFKRAIKIKKSTKKKLLEHQKQEQIKKLEKEVRKNQALLLVSAVPLIALSSSVETIVKNTEKETIVEKNIPVSKYINDNSKNNQEYENVELKISDKENVTIEFANIERTILPNENISEKGKKSTENIEEEIDTKEENKTSEKTEVKEQTEKTPIILFPLALLTATKENHQKEIATYEEQSALRENDEFQKIQNKKIIELYEQRMKDVRSDLRKLIFEYNSLVDESDKLIRSEESEELLNKLSLIIKKMEVLEEKIKIEDISKYDDNYLYQLVNEYIEVFDNQEFVSTIKDSPMYVEISAKLTELNQEKDKLQKKVEKRLENLEEKEDKLEEINNKYFNFLDFSNKLSEFQDNAKRITEDLEEKVKTSVSVIEEKTTKVEGMSKQIKLLLTLLGLTSLKNPGVRNSKATAVATLTGLYFLNKMKKRKVVVEKKKIVKVEDYSKSIENKITDIDDIERLLHKTSSEIDKFIRDFTEEYQEFFGKIKECDRILINLETIKSNISEKEYEIEKIKQDQKDILYTNNQKVKAMQT